MTPLKRWLAFAALTFTAAPLLVTAAAQSAAQPSPAQPLPAAQLRRGAALELVHTFSGHMPVGVSVSSGGRIFISYPRWEDPVPYSVAELVNGKAVPYPSGGPGGQSPNAQSLNTQTVPLSSDRFVGVQGLLVDGRDRLWVLDTGTVNLGPILDQRAPKLVGIDTRSNRVIRTIRFPANVVLNNTYLNDLRIDLRQGRDGVAYITDSGARSGGGIIVVDLASGHSWRKLTNDASVRAEPKFVPVTDGSPLYLRPKGGVAKYLNLSSDGIAISPDGGTLYYTPLASRRLYSVPTAALRDEGLSDAGVASQVRDLGEKGVADGLGEDTAGNVYTTNYEQNAILRRSPDGELRTVVRDPRLIWPDTLSLHGGYLYILSDQLNRQGAYHWGHDLRKPPYALFRVRMDAQPVILK